MMPKITTKFELEMQVGWVKISSICQCICCKKHDCIIYRQQIDQVEFEHYHTNVCQQLTFLGLCSNLLSTDACFLVIVLSGQSDIVDFV